MMKSKTIRILCATDNNYAPYCGVMLTSFLENHKAFHTEVYIIVKSRLKGERKMGLLEKRYDVSINFIVFPHKDLASSFPVGSPRWTEETYYRLFAAELLPQEVRTILYLDCDIIVDRDVSELFFIDMDDISALVVTDAPSHVIVSHASRLGYPEEKGYFNAGMMLMNLEYWRKNNISAQCIDFISKNYSKLAFCDQDVLNVILLDSKKMIPVIYNFQEDLVVKKNYELYDDELKNLICTQKPKIIHYTGFKPWTIFSYGRPFLGLWRGYKRRSMWWYLMDRLPKEKPFNYFIKRYFLWPFGIYLQKTEVIVTVWMK